MDVIKIKVKTNCGSFRIEDRGDYFLVEITSPARDNKANIEIVKELGKHFGSRVRIVKGFKNREKLVELIHQTD